MPIMGAALQNSSVFFLLLFHQTVVNSCWHLNDDSKYQTLDFMHSHFDSSSCCSTSEFRQPCVLVPQLMSPFHASAMRELVHVQAGQRGNQTEMSLWHQFRSFFLFLALTLGLVLLARWLPWRRGQGRLVQVCCWLRRRLCGVDCAAARRLWGVDRSAPALSAAPSSPEVAPPGESSPEAPALASPTSPTLPSDASGGNGRYGFCVKQGPRASMEDAVDAIEQLGSSCPATEFYAVYDGHGGSSAVEFVKRRLPLIISSRAGYGDTSRIDEALHEAFALTDEELLKPLRLEAMPPQEAPESTFVLSSGSCACIALVRRTACTLRTWEIAVPFCAVGAR
jgi:hypothetical protein